MTSAGLLQAGPLSRAAHVSLVPVVLRLLSFYPSLLSHERWGGAVTGWYTWTTPVSVHGARPHRIAVAMHEHLFPKWALRDVSLVPWKQLGESIHTTETGRRGLCFCLSFSQLLNICQACGCHSPEPDESEGPATLMAHSSRDSKGSRILYCTTHLGCRTCTVGHRFPSQPHGAMQS